jgi:cyclic pyranopterin phosphate synthase
MTALIDTYGRYIDYLRISITDHCNLQCRYCAPFSGRSHLPRNEILTYEEMFTVVEAAVLAGITKIRITGGEPLVRNGLVEFCKMLSGIDGLEGLSLTTNGILLEDMAKPLFDAGVCRVNVSLDTLKTERYQKITGHKLISRVFAGIKRSEEVGMHPIKINMVVMRGINDDEIEDFARLTIDKPYHVRFIELMPTEGWALSDHDSLFVPVEEMMKKIKKIGEVHIWPASDSYGPAKVCSLPGVKGKVGFIAPLSWHFCSACNRMRLTADGKLRACLFSKDEIDIKGAIRSGASLAELGTIFKQAATAKPQGHRLDQTNEQSVIGRAMRAIGG